MKLKICPVNIGPKGIKRFLYFLCSNAFWIIIIFILIDAVFAEFIFYKYVYIAENQKIESNESILKFDNSNYQSVLEKFTENRESGVNSESYIVNPASTYCQEQGGELVIKTKEDGSQYGLCYFEDARACEEWALYRGECPIGGVKTTGFDTEAQRFCAWSGGSTFVDENAVCTFDDGSACYVDDFYNGNCQPDSNKK